MAPTQRKCNKISPQQLEGNKPNPDEGTEATQAGSQISSIQDIQQARPAAQGKEPNLGVKSKALDYHVYPHNLKYLPRTTLITSTTAC